jgi:hypothetical protein
LFPAQYTWFVCLSTLDLLCTWRILHAAGQEENALADWIIEHYELPGLVVFKFLLVAGVILICEIVGRRRRELGARLARWAVVLTAFPVVVGTIHVFRIIGGVGGPPPSG